MIIGFSNGDFYRLFQNELERFSKKYINLYKANNLANAIELNCLNEGYIDYIILSNNLDLSYFKYISLHAPNLLYQKNDVSNRILSKLVEVYKKYSIKNIVIHVDMVKDWDIFSNYSMLPISIENMDDRKDFGKSIADIKSILEKYNFNLTLDLQHCFVNDSTMKLAFEFQKLFNKRIVEYHISGFEKDLSHYPLFKSSQDEIIYSLQFKNLPIIIESTFDKIGEHKKELLYIKQKLNF